VVILLVRILGRLKVSTVRCLGIKGIFPDLVPDLDLDPDLNAYPTA